MLSVKNACTLRKLSLGSARLGQVGIKELRNKQILNQSRTKIGAVNAAPRDCAKYHGFCDEVAKLTGKGCSTQDVRIMTHIA